MSDFPRTAFLLGAGLGTRLRPLTENCPKPLLPIGGRPMIAQAMDKLHAAGTRRFIINTHHCPEAWALVFPSGRYGDAEVKLVHEPVLLETGGGLANIAGLLGEDDKDLIVWNGDILSGCDIAAAYAHHRTNGGAATLDEQPVRLAPSPAVARNAVAPRLNFSRPRRDSAGVSVRLGCIVVITRRCTG